MTAITFRTNDPAKWGTGAGANLTPTQVDTNFWNLKQAVEALESSPPEAVSVDEIIQTGNSITFHLTNGTTQGPFTLPAAQISWRGDWAASTAYAVGDIVSSGSALYVVLTAHTSAGSFDPGATNGSGQDYYDQILGQSLPGGGTEGQRLTKASGADYDFEWTAEPVPTGGATGQILAKASGTDYDLEWTDAPSSLPTGGTTGQVLTKLSGTNYDVGWVDTAVDGSGGGGSGPLVYAFLSLSADKTLTTPGSYQEVTWTAENADASALHVTNSGYLKVPSTATLVRVGCCISAKSMIQGKSLWVQFESSQSTSPSLDVYLPAGQSFATADGYTSVSLTSGPIPVGSDHEFSVIVQSDTSASTLVLDKWNTHFWLEVIA